MTKVFIDGSAGTAGLRIRSRLEGRADLDVSVLEGEARKDTEKRREMLNSCDIAVLCLPDEASRESVAIIENPAVRVVDTSTAHRVAPGWAYGFPELSAAHREAIVFRQARSLAGLPRRRLHSACAAAHRVGHTPGRCAFDLSLAHRLFRRRQGHDS